MDSLLPFCLHLWERDSQWPRNHAPLETAATVSCTTPADIPALTPLSQLTKDGHHRRIVLLIVGARSFEVFFECDQIAYFGYVKQRLPLRAALYLMYAQQFSSSGAHAIALRFRQARRSIVGKTESALFLDCIDDNLIHGESFQLNLCRKHAKAERCRTRFAQTNFDKASE